MFGRNKDKTRNHQPVEPRYIYIKSMYGFTEHIGVKNDANTGSTALCGYDNGIDTTVDATIENVTRSLPNQHRSFLLCTGCVEVFTGVPADEQRKDVHL